MALIDKETVLAEIVRRIESLNNPMSDFSEGRRAEIRSFYDFICSLDTSDNFNKKD